METAEKVKAEKNSNLVYHIGTMIEIPRADVYKRQGYMGGGKDE